MRSIVGPPGRGMKTYTIPTARAGMPRRGWTKHGPRAKEGMLGTCAMGFVAHSSIGYSQESYMPFTGTSIGAMVKGYGWEVWKAAVLRRPGVLESEIQETTVSSFPCVTFTGNALIAFLSMQKVVFLGHAPPRDFCEEIKMRSRIGTKIGLYFVNFESVNSQLAGNSFLRPPEEVTAEYLYTSPTAQSGDATCFFVDLFEGQPGSPGCGILAPPPSSAGHVWQADVTSSEYQSAWLDSLSTIMPPRYGRGILDYVLVDNVLPNPTYLANVTNEDPALTPTVYSNGWKALWAAAEAVTPYVGEFHLVGNCPISSATYTNAQVPRRYGEHFFYDEQTSSNTDSEDWTAIESRIRAAASQELILPHTQLKSAAGAWNARSYGATHVDNWVGTKNGPGGTKGTWKQLRDLVFELGIQDRLFPVCGREGTSNKFPLTFQEDAFAEPS